ncbi:MAG: MotA/TolQ/ExbB proton channel family protein [Bacteroidales bacterium]|nr:MotA/TolQ/ExbB proton channel family protein [Bacteroidales bacterium]MBQ7984013.1 MotA/TolQ/ExbB proton channel family protein [Bacteroidales bacterium]
MLTSILLQANALAEQTVQATTKHLDIFSLAVKGGWIMAVLAILSLGVIYIFVERYLALNKALKEDTSFMNNVKNCIHNNDLQGAKNLCAANDSPIGRMIGKGLSRLGRPLNDINQAVENVGKMEVAKLESGVSMVATISNLAPSIGFLGTVTGMVKAFFDMANAGNNIDIQLLSSGIYEAMVTTVGGLIVGLIASFLYSILVGRINKVVFILESRTMEFMDLLHEPAA